MPLVEDFAPDLLEELRGVAEGAGTGLLDLMALNARGEIVYDRTFARMGRPPQAPGTAGAEADAEPAEAADGCSSFALLPPPPATGTSGPGRTGTGAPAPAGPWSPCAWCSRRAPPW